MGSLNLRRRALSLSGIVALLLLWDGAIRMSGSTILPGPLAVARGIVELARKGLLVKHVVASLFRVTWGYLLALVLAVPLGLTLGWFRRGERALNPILQVLRPISPLAWIPIAILWFGVGDLASIFIIFTASFLPLSLSAINAAHHVPLVHLQAGRNFGLSSSQLVWRVIYPAVLPQLLVGMRLALGIAWLVVVAAEMIAVNSGLGFLIIDSRNAGNRYDLVMAGMVLIGAIGLALDAGIRRIGRARALSWAAPQTAGVAP